MTAYDWLLGRRAAALGIALALLLLLAMLGTDDAASTHAGRLGRLAALSSLAGGGAACLAMAQARSRGEIRALGAMGLPHARASLGAVLGGAFVGMLGAALVLVPGIDLAPLFPHALPAGGGWVRENGGWLDAARGVRVGANGALSWVDASRPGTLATLPSPPVIAILIALGVAAVAFPLWATARVGVVRRALVTFAVASAAVFVFHLVAADRLGAAVLVLPPLLLLADGVALHLGGEWS